MATQGVLSITKNGKTAIKVVCGNNGFNIPKLADHIRTLKKVTPELVFGMAKELAIGSEESLVVQYSPCNYLADPDMDEISDLYCKHFSDPRFNPRWNNGTADFIEVIEL